MSSPSLYLVLVEEREHCDIQLQGKSKCTGVGKLPSLSSEQNCLFNQPKMLIRPYDYYYHFFLASVCFLFGFLISVLYVLPLMYCCGELKIQVTVLLCVSRVGGMSQVKKWS